MGSLTTHVLDVAHGRPAAGIRITLRRITDSATTTLLETVMNHDGRCDAPLLQGAAFTAGRYELVFAVGRYFAEEPGAPADSPAFLDDVVVRFGVGHPDQHYHVPLLVSPYSYTTYRGS